MIETDSSEMTFQTRSSRIGCDWDSIFPRNIDDFHDIFRALHASNNGVGRRRVIPVDIEHDN